MASVRKNLTIDLSLIEFYLRIQPLLAMLEEGHTDLPIPKESYNAQNPYELPYTFKLTLKKPYIIYNSAKVGYVSDLPINAEIISINGIPAKRIVEDIVLSSTPGKHLISGRNMVQEILAFILKASIKQRTII